MAYVQPPKMWKGQNLHNTRLIVQWIHQRWPHKFDTSELHYTHSHELLTLICKIHGPFEIAWRVLKNSIFACNGCAIEDQTLNEDEVFSRIVLKWPHFDLSETLYENCAKPMKIRCTIHNKTFYITWNSLRVAQFACPLCVQENTEFRMIGKREESIGPILQKMGFDAEPQKEFRDCVYKQPLPFDYWIEEINTAIEYQGEQHYDPDDFRNRKPGKWEERQEKDQIKKDYCDAKGYHLIEIPYWIEDIAQYLADHLFT